MPRRLTKTKPNTHQTLKNSSYESVVVRFLMQDGWQVFLPVLDHGNQTDDGPNYFRVQVKTVGAIGNNHVVHNQWKDSNIDCVVFFAINSNWGVIAPAFEEDCRPITHDSHVRFNQGKKEFLTAFHKLEV